MAMEISSPSFKPNGEIPAPFTCEGRDVSPELRFSGVPAGAKSLVLIVDDPDAPDPKAPRTTWVHWVLYDIPPKTAGIKEAMTSRDLPKGIREGLNDWNHTGYGGPCPPIGRHRYFFKLYALSKELGDLKRVSKGQVVQAMEGAVIEKAEMIGTYEKKH
ncbi:MAG: YbhB/YbcL family Raf kinase inhibitor-like protein [Pseudomonadota bacterium]